MPAACRTTRDRCFQAIKAAQAFFATQGSLPVNVKFLFEGEEEIGSPSLEPFIAGAHAICWPPTSSSRPTAAMWRINEPSVTIASRGLAGLEFTLTGAAKDLHSGRHGGAVANPLHAMAELVASLHAPDGRVAVAGFYDDVVELPPDERAEIAALPFDEAAYLAEVGAPAAGRRAGLHAPSSASGRGRRWRSTACGAAIRGRAPRPSPRPRRTPRSPAAWCRTRTRPTSPRKIIRHLEAHLPAGVRLAVSPEAHAAQPYRIPADHIGLRVAEAALAEIFGVQPLTVRMGGTVPVCEVFKRLMGLDTVFFSFSTADEDFHAPNEFFRIHRLHEGLEAWARYWELLAAA